MWIDAAHTDEEENLLVTYLICHWRDNVARRRCCWLLFHVGIVMIDDEKEKKKEEEEFYPMVKRRRRREWNILCCLLLIYPSNRFLFFSLSRFSSFFSPSRSLVCLLARSRLCWIFLDDEERKRTSTNSGKKKSRSFVWYAYIHRHVMMPIEQRNTHRLDGWCIIKKIDEEKKRNRRRKYVNVTTYDESFS